MITLDWTLAVAVVVFLLTVWFLNRLLFSPLSEIMEERRERSEGKRAAAAEKGRYRDALLAECLERIQAEKKQGIETAEHLRRESQNLRTEALSRARDQASAKLLEAKAEFQKAAAEAEDTLKKDADELSNVIAARILSKS